jgi:hypothetical protein
VEFIQQHPYLDIGRFDISGFGFQFPREYIVICMNVIRELYPNSFLDMMGDEYNAIFKDGISVDMPNGEVVHPPRGTGLGYYEDIKTIVMMSLLQDFQLISVYGDQGLIDANMGYFAMFELQRYGFEFSDMSKYQVVSDTNTSEWSIKWGGYKVRPNSITKTKSLLNPLLGCFFTEYHWERKNSLFSFYEQNKEFYKSREKRLIRYYNLYFGNEFYRDELKGSFIDAVGISACANYTIGTKKDYKIKDYRVPYEDTTFEAAFITPFRKSRSKVWPKSIGKAFHELRRKVYRQSITIDSSVYYYTNPRIKYNNRLESKERLLPEWAEYLYCFLYGATTGSLTYNMSPVELERAIQRNMHSSDPIRSAARGGYKILDYDHVRSVPSSEWTAAVEGLKLIKRRELDYASRADQPVHKSMVEDPLYYNEDISRINMRGLEDPYDSNDDYEYSQTGELVNNNNISNLNTDKDLSNISDSLRDHLRTFMGTGHVQNPLDLLLAKDKVVNSVVRDEDFSFAEDDDYEDHYLDVDVYCDDELE